MLMYQLKLESEQYCIRISKLRDMQKNRSNHDFFSVRDSRPNETIRGRRKLHESFEIETREAGVAGWSAYRVTGSN